MNEHRDHIIAEFSTFFTISPHQNHSPLLQRDRVNAQFMAPLTATAPTVNADGWARYCLLICQQAATLGSEPPSTTEWHQTLTALIEYLVKKAPTVNAGLMTLHQHLSSQAITYQTQLRLYCQPDTIKRLLIAYLQRPCWFAAQKQQQKFSPSIKDQFSFPDCHQELNHVISDPGRFLKTFDLTQPNITIKTYVEKALCKQLSNIIYAKLGNRKRFSDWGLLRHSTRKDLLAALSWHGFSALESTQHRLIWQCFGEIYTVKAEGQNKLPPPNREHLANICDRYNQLRDQSQFESDITESFVLKALQTCIQAIRRYQSRGLETTPFEETLHSVEGGASEINALLDRDSSESDDPFEQIIETTETNRINSTKNAALLKVKLLFLSLELAEQTALRLLYGLEFNQSEVAQILGEPLKSQPQYQRFRYFTRCKKPLLAGLTQAIRESYPDLFPANQPTDDRIELIRAYLDLQLNQQCKAYFHPPLIAHCVSLNDIEKKLLSLYDWHQVDKQTVAETLHPDPAHPSHQRIRFIETFYVLLKKWTETALQIDLTVCQTAPQKLVCFVQTWLADPIVRAEYLHQVENHDANA